jgi:hypothetical protein
MNNPFRRMMCGHEVEDIVVQSRLDRVREFNAEQLRAVLALDDVQKTVRAAAERRLRQLEKMEKAEQK